MSIHLSVRDRDLIGGRYLVFWIFAGGWNQGDPRGVWMQVKKQMLGFTFVTSETVVEKNSDWSNAQPSKHSSVLSRLVLTELFSANSCHWGSTYLDQWGRNWCQWVERIMQYWEEIAKIRNLLQRSSLAPEESMGMNALSRCFGSIWNTITLWSSNEGIEQVNKHGYTWSYMTLHVIHAVRQDTCSIDRLWLAGKL